MLKTFHLLGSSCSKPLVYGLCWVIRSLILDVVLLGAFWMLLALLKDSSDVILLLRLLPEFPS